jgi:hypothetical protein
LLLPASRELVGLEASGSLDAITFFRGQGTPKGNGRGTLVYTRKLVALGRGSQMRRARFLIGPPPAIKSQLDQVAAVLAYDNIVLLACLYAGFRIWFA